VAWLPGILCILVGVLWLILRAIVEKKAGAGSFWSQLVKEFAVIRNIPVVGWLWTILPVLLMVLGICWLMGWVPSWLKQDVPSPACGAIRSKPPEISPLSWPRYSCKSQSAAGDAWDSCLPRTAYTDEARRGCPGADRCCPP
jgi:hypothetical protein